MRMRVFRNHKARPQQRQLTDALCRMPFCFAAFIIGFLALSPATAGETITYSYDALGRLIKVVHSGTVNSNTSSCYGLDSADNRTLVAISTTTACAIATPAVTFSVNDVSVTEGGNLAFTVTKTGTASGTVTVSYDTADGTAVAGSDYTTKSGSLTFLSTDTSKTVSVATTDDTLVENSETLFLNLSNATGGAAISDNQGVGTINDNDNACAGVSFTIASNGAVTEGANSAFTVTKTGTTSSSCSVSYATSSGSSGIPSMNATSGSDFTATSGPLTFTSTQTSQTINVPTIDDTILESDESFAMTLSNPDKGGTLGATGSASGTINDNDECRGVTFTIASNGPVTEGAGSTFTITKSGSTSYSCAVNYGTTNGTAAAPGDYTATFGTANFTSTQTSASVIVPTLTDSLSEGAETFSMGLSSPTYSGLVGSPSSATATINNGSGSGACLGVSFSIADATAVVEGTPLSFTVTKSNSTSSSCSVDYATANGTATEPTYYTRTSGTLAFGPSVATLSVSVTTVDQNADKGTSANMYVNLSNQTTGAGIADPQAIGTIRGSYICTVNCTQSVDPGAVGASSTSTDPTGTTTDPPPPPQ